MSIQTKVHWTPLMAPGKHPMYTFSGFAPSTTVLPKGHLKAEGKRPLPCDLLFDRDVAVSMRDGITIYTDVFRSTDATQRVPAVIGWSPYGKTGDGVQSVERIAPFRAGLATQDTSGYEKFEMLDPAEWIPRGYAILSPDARGAGMSEGDIQMWGQKDAEDVYDFIDWIVKQPWSNGAVTMAGNSWLAMAQVNHAARAPHPALKCIAPWEGFTDLYRHNAVRGGAPWAVGFGRMIAGGFAGHGRLENYLSMAGESPLYTDIWEAKNVPLQQIQVPVYATASYSTLIHTMGSFDTFRKAASRDKWIRVITTQEWFDLYQPEATAELQAFFDHYTKGVQNEWLATPRVRLSLIGFSLPNVVNRVVESYPPPSTAVAYFLDACTGAASLAPIKDVSTTSYEAHHLTDCAEFRVSFTERTELAGYPKLRVWVSCHEHDDMDVVVQLRKVDGNGQALTHLNYPCPVPETDVPDTNPAKFHGPQGVLRASHACTLDMLKSTPSEPFYRHDRRIPIPPGTVVPLDIGIWPIGMVFDAGEGLLVRISGHDMALPEIEMARVKTPEDANVGTHVIHTGGKYDTHLLLPVLPAV